MDNDEVILLLLSHGYQVGVTTLVTMDGNSPLDITVSVSPILVDEKIGELRELLPAHKITKQGTNFGLGVISIT